MFTDYLSKTFGAALCITGIGTISNLARAGGSCEPQWHPLDTGMGGVPGVIALTEFNSELIAGGQFTMAGGAQANRIARWDGIEWHPLGSGMNGRVQALTVYNGSLIAGGAFNEAGGVGANYIARWDGTEWHPLGSGMGGPVDNAWVYALTIYNGDLIAGGTFLSAGGVAVNYVTRWDGTSWHPLGSGVNSDFALGVTALAVYNGELIVGGSFLTAGGAAANRIARWNGASWQPLGSGLNSEVWALAVYNSQLIVGGWFTEAGGSTANYIAGWNGAAWQSLGSGMNHRVQALAEYNGKLITGGLFITAGGSEVNRIARWDGTQWLPLGTGLNGSTFALTVQNDSVVAGGFFTLAGSQVANNIARWGDCVAFSHVDLSSSESCVAQPIDGTLLQQVASVNSSPPLIPDASENVARKNENSNQDASFICDQVPDPLAQPYVSAKEYLLLDDELTWDNCSSAWYQFIFDVPQDAIEIYLSGVANVDDLGVLYLNGHQVSASIINADLLKIVDRVDAFGRPLLNWPTQDTFSIEGDELFIIGGQNRLVFGVVGDASEFDPTGLEFRATVTFIVSPDSDGDGFRDSEDNCQGVANPSQADSDGDGIGNVCDNCPANSNSNQLDSDADGIGDVCDNCASVNNPEQTDCNNNGIGDSCDIASGAPDCNGNGFLDSCDIANGESEDTNNNGVPDGCENDSDGDGIPDDQDNAPQIFNPGQEDSDNDDVPDVLDNCIFTANTNQFDIDADGVGDACDNCIYRENLAQLDGDGDGYGDECDECAGSVSGDVLSDCDGRPIVQVQQRLTYSLPSLPLVDPITVIAALTTFIIEQCIHVEFLNLSDEISFASGNVHGNFDADISAAAAMETYLGIVQDGSVNIRDLVPSFAPCPIVEELGSIRGNINLYSFDMGVGGTRVLEAEGSVTWCDRVRVSTPHPIMLEVPIKIAGTAFAAESFGAINATRGYVRVQLAGHVGETIIPDTLYEIQSVSVIPATQTILQEYRLPLTVEAGDTCIDVFVTAEVYVEASAKSAGLAGLVAGSATAGINFNDSLVIGNFTGENGGPIPSGVSIKSARSDFVYNNFAASDFNGDGVVNVFDLFELLGAWGTDGTGAALAEPTDIVDVFDLFVLLGAWG